MTTQLGYVMPAEMRGQVEGAAYVDALDRALARAAGVFDSAWMVDHVQNEDPRRAQVEAFTALAFMAGRHPRLRFGTLVMCALFRSPALAAKMAANLQFLSGGRFILGIGAGWNAAEFRAYGYDFPPNAERVDRLEEALQVIHAMWQDPPADFIGQYCRVSGAYCAPRPNPAPPIIIGAFGPRMLRLAARYAGGWNVSSTGPARYRRLAADFAQACAAVGRDPATVRRSWAGGVACARSRAEAEALGGERVRAEEDDYGLVGTPEDVAEQMRGLMALGVDDFMLDFEGFPDLACLELFLEGVAPRLVPAAS